MGTKSLQKSITKIIEKNNHILDRFRTDFCSILASNIDIPGGPTKWFLELSGWSWANLGPRWPQDLSKRALAPILADLCTNFDRFWDHLCLILGPTLIDYSTYFGICLCNAGKCMAVCSSQNKGNADLRGIC